MSLFPHCVCSTEDIFNLKFNNRVHDTNTDSVLQLNEFLTYSEAAHFLLRWHSIFVNIKNLQCNLKVFKIILQHKILKI